MKDSFDSASLLFRAIEKEWTEFEDIFTFEAYRWAWSTVNTRAVFMPHDLTTLESGDPRGNSAKCLALAPLLDLLNHSSHVEVRKSCCQYSMDFVINIAVFLIISLYRQLHEFIKKIIIILYNFIMYRYIWLI